MSRACISEIPAFSTFGPPPIASFDWDNLYHRTSLVSCLVQGVYTMERDREAERVGLNSLAKDWWEGVGFTLDKSLIDEEDGSIHGAVFQKGYNNHQNTLNSAVAPQYVIAFRGTIVKRETFLCDLKNDIRIFFESLQCGKRCEQIIQEIENYVNVHGNTAVWIAGHSLGAGLALHAGKIMAKSGLPVEAYIFNPPSSLFPLEKLFKRHQKIKSALRITRDFAKAFVTVTTVITVATAALVLNDVLNDDLNDEVEEENSLMNLASWSPHLFVNRSDPICSEYIGHFQHKVQMAKLGLGSIESLAAEISFRSMLFGGGETSSSNYSSQHLHFLPSAIMIENKIESPDSHTNHGIHQWWNHMLEHQSTATLYEFHS